MPSRTIAIGDVHGCSRALDALLECIQPTRDDTLVPLGDFVDRGPDSRRVLDRLLELETTCRLEPILGNHEEMMMMVLTGQMAPSGWLRYGGVNTLDSYGFAGDLSVISESHRDFLKRCHDFFETPSHFFVHANYVPHLALPETDREVLRWWSLIHSMPGPHQSGKVGVMGHTPDKTGEILDMGFLKCIDTYCYGGKWLTALDVTSGTIWQANDAGQLRRP